MTNKDRLTNLETITSVQGKDIADILRTIREFNRLLTPYVKEIVTYGGYDCLATSRPARKTKRGK